MVLAEADPGLKAMSLHVI